MGGPSVFLAPRGCRHGVGAQHVTGEASRQRVLTTDTPGSVHNKLSGGVIPDDRTVMGSFIKLKELLYISFRYILSVSTFIYLRFAPQWPWAWVWVSDPAPLFYLGKLNEGCLWHSCFRSPPCLPLGRVEPGMRATKARSWVDF